MTVDPNACLSSLPRRSSENLPTLYTALGEVVSPWKTTSKKRDHAIHRMMARLGSFPPALVRYLIYGYSESDHLVFDPFCGKGTTLVEALLAGRRALGCDIAPDAVAVTRAKMSRPSTDEVDRYMRRLTSQAERAAAPDPSEVPDHVAVFYHPDTIRELMTFRRALLRSHTRSANFLIGCLLGILHGKSRASLSIPSAHAYAMAPRYVRNYAAKHGLAAPRRSVTECLRAKASQYLEEPLPNGSASVYLSSAERYSFERSTGALDETVDLIITSPPYLNAQTYAKDAWLRLWFLGWNYRDLRPRFIETGSSAVYRRRMSPCLANMLRVLKPGGHAFIVAGDATGQIKGEPTLVRTADLLVEIACTITEGGYSWKAEEMIDDFVTAHSRYLFPVHSNGKSPKAILPKEERILHLIKIPRYRRSYC